MRKPIFHRLPSNSIGGFVRCRQKPLTLDDDHYRNNLKVEEEENKVLKVNKRKATLMNREREESKDGNTRLVTKRGRKQIDEELKEDQNELSEEENSDYEVDDGDDGEESMSESSNLSESEDSESDDNIPVKEQKINQQHEQFMIGRGKSKPKNKGKSGNKGGKNKGKGNKGKGKGKGKGKKNNKGGRGKRGFAKKYRDKYANDLWSYF